MLVATLISCSQEGNITGNAVLTTTMPKRTLTYMQQVKAHRIDSLFTLLYKSGDFNGNALIAQNDTIIFQKSFGVSDKVSGKLLHDSSSFQLASVSKTFTAAAILTLVDKGALKLDDYVTKYISDFPWAKVQIKHLLSHRTGLANYIYLFDKMAKTRKLPFNNKEMICLFDSACPKKYFDVNKKFDYSNTNYFLLASIVERVTGLDFNEYISAAIFKPLGMKHTFLTSDTVKLNSFRNTKGYTLKWQEVKLDAFDGVFGDKGLYSCTGDMLLFANAYFNAKLISKATLKDAISPKSPEDKIRNYGYGWRMKDFETNDSNKLVFHNGWWHGYRTAFQRRLIDNTTVIILSNTLNTSTYQTWKVFNALDGINDSTKVNNTIDIHETRHGH